MRYAHSYQQDPHRHRHRDYEPARYLTRSCRSKRVYQEDQGNPENQKCQPHNQVDTWILTGIFRFAQTIPSVGMSAKSPGINPVRADIREPANRYSVVTILRFP